MRRSDNSILLDFQMSKVFGPDWIKNDSKRMSEFAAIMGYEIERDQLNQRKQKQGYGTGR